MCPNENGKLPTESSMEKEELMQSLNDERKAFTKEDLAQIIRNEFFNDDNPLSDETVDAALKRSMLLDGETITEESLQKRREGMIKDVFREILGMDSEK